MNVKEKKKRSLDSRPLHGLAEACRRAGITQDDLAELTARDIMTVRGWYGGGNVLVGMRRSLARLLDCSLMDLENGFPPPILAQDPLPGLECHEITVSDLIACLRDIQKALNEHLGI